MSRTISEVSVARRKETFDIAIEIMSGTNRFGRTAERLIRDFYQHVSIAQQLATLDRMGVLLEHADNDALIRAIEDKWSKPANIGIRDFKSFFPYGTKLNTQPFRQGNGSQLKDAKLLNIAMVICNQNRARNKLENQRKQEEKKVADATEELRLRAADAEMRAKMEVQQYYLMPF